MMTRHFVPLVLAMNAAVFSAFADDPAARFASMTPEQVRAFEDEVKAKIKTLDGTEALEAMADLALIPPRMNTSPLPEYGYDRLDYGMTIGIERTPGGRLWACWVAGGDSPKAFFVLATSDDDGETWSEPQLVVDSHNANLPRDRSVLVGNLWTDPLGRLWLVFDQSMDMFDGRGGVWVSVCKNPDDDQPAWSQPRRIWHGVTLNKPTVLSTGEWMLPVSFDQRGGLGAFKGTFKELDPYRGANVFVSTDQGATWQRRGMATFPKPDWHEHMIVERKDGTLWMLARTGNGIMESVSTDGGRSWSEPILSKIKHPVARFHIRRLASGRILLVKHGDTIDSHEGRSKLTAWLSDDEGKTWQGGLMLDERKGVSYPDGFQAPDGMIYISHDRNRSKDGEILLSRFTEEDVLAGKLVDPRSKRKMLISRPLARDVAKLPEFAGPTPGMSRTITIPTVDISGQGKARLVVFGDGLDWRRKGRPPYPMHQAVSEDNGKTWTPMKPNGVQGEVPPKTILSFDEGRRLILWSDLPGYVVQSESLDGGLTWRRQRHILRIPNRWGQPCVIRSPDGKQLLMLLRENSRRYHSLFSTSNDNAQSWSEPRELPAPLTGDRHVARYAPDGRLVVAMRDMAKTNPTYGHYVAWVGQYEDIVEGRKGQYRIKLLHNATRTDKDVPGTGNTDCGYSDLEVLPDGTIVATTYVKYRPGPEKNSVVNTRFKLSEIDALAKEN